MSSVRSSAGARPARGGARKSATTSIASVAEPPLPSASSRPPASNDARSAAAAASSVARPSVSVCARSSPTSSAFISTDAPHVVEHRVEVGLPLAPGTGRGSSTRRCRARRARPQQAAVVEEHVHELPEHVVGGLGQLLARRTGRRPAARAPLGPDAPNADACRQPRSARSSAALRRRRRRRSRCRPARRPAPTCSTSGPPSARQRRAPAARACRRSPDGRTRPPRGARPSAPAATPPNATSRPPRGEALGHAVAEPRDPLGLGVEEARVRLGAARQQLVDADRRRGAALTPAPARRRAPRASASRGTRPRPRRCGR